MKPKDFEDTCMVPYKVEKGEMPPLRPVPPDPRHKWELRLIKLATLIAVLACAAAVFIP